MGYYSEVALVLTKAGVVTLNKRLNDESIPSKIRDKTNDLLQYANKHLVCNDCGSEIWHWNAIKWYEGDPQYFQDVDFITKLLNDLDLADYRFIRIGEDNDDNEIRGCYLDDPFDLSLYRSINICDAV